jgi:hypothetical protein
MTERIMSEHGATEQNKFDTSGKSPAYSHHRKYQARAGKLVAGFLNRPPAAVIERGNYANKPNLSRTKRLAPACKKSTELIGGSWPITARSAPR